MNLRLFVLGVVLLAAVLALLLVSPAGEVALSSRDVRAAEARIDREAAALGDLPDAGRRTTLDEPEAEPEEAAPLARASNRPRTLERRTGVGNVVVRTKLVLDDGSKVSFAGHKVTAQSWIRETEEIFHHEAFANEEGIAEIIFEGFVHIDYLRYDPPQGSGLALAVEEYHIDLSPGSTFEETLTIGPGGVLDGRVLRDDGAPAAGVLVHAYHSGLWTDVENWEPGLAEAITDASGRYVFPSLPPGEWGVAVKPEGWLQVDPSIEDPEDGFARQEVRVGERTTAPDFRVAPLHRFRLVVLDQGGDPVPNLRLSLTPTLIHSPSLSVRAGSTRGNSAIESFIRGEAAAGRRPDAGVTWPYGSLRWTTNDQGELSCFAVRGSWDATFSTPLDRSRSSANHHRMTLEVPTSDRTIRLPQSLWDLQGRVVDLDGDPISRAKARLVWSHDGRADGTSARSNEEGIFQFRALAPYGDYRLHIGHAEHLEAEWSVPLGDTPTPREYALRPSVRLRFRALDLDGNPIPNLRFSLLSGVADGLAQPLRSSETAWLERAIKANRRRQTGRRSGQVLMSGLLPGSYEVGLMLPFSTGEVDRRGRPRTEEQVFQRWFLRTQEELHELTVDLSAYSPPKPPEMALHHGVVLDRVSGAPVPRARVMVSSQRYRRSTRSNGEGRFRASAPAGSTTFSVTAEGYLPSRTTVQIGGPGDYRHELFLEPGGALLALRVVDRNGATLPDVELNFQDAAGRSLQCFVPRRPGRDPEWRSNAVARAGAITVRGLPPGTLHMEVEFWGHRLSRASVQVGGGTEPQQATAYLTESLEEIRQRLAERIGRNE